jgi:UDP-N-acetylenolpyruvoylglucosamine reductase
MNTNFSERLLSVLGNEKVKQGEPMKKHTTFRIGGMADYLVLPETIEEVQAIVMLCKTWEVPYYILGNGSNVLVGDNGYRGVIIKLYKNMNEMIVTDTTIEVKAGVLLSQVANLALENSLVGLEFAAGIPGTIGGAVVMNAGAYGGEMKDVITEVTVLLENGEIRKFRGEEMQFGYRTSLAAKENYIILQVTLSLKKGEKEAIHARMEELKVQRTTKQPLNYPSAGSTFKRPVGHFAGKLIEDAGLRGFQVGGAKVSDKHCGFVVNVGDATARDVDMLMQQIVQRVYEQTGVTLEAEIKRLGEFA